MNNKDALVIGLTGQSGSGKTTVCHTFENEGFDIINADLIAREVTKKDTQCSKAIFDRFPYFFTDGILDRAKTARYVFNDKKLLEEYSAVIYPYIIEEIDDRIKRFKNNGSEFILLDAPTLFEAGADKLCDVIVCVIADEALRAKRIALRDNIDYDMIKSRFSSQHNDSFYIERSDFVITNNSTYNDLVEKSTETARLIKGSINDKISKKKEE